MDLNLFKNMYIEKALCSVTYSPMPDIEREISTFEKSLTNEFDSPANLTRVPRATNPEIPRFIFQNPSKKRLEVAVVRSTLSFEFKNQSIDKAKKLFKDKSELIFSIFKSYKKFEIDGTILNFQIKFPLRNKEDDIASMIHGQFINIGFPGRLLNSAFSFSIEKDELIYEYFIGAYTSLQHDIKVEQTPEAQKGFFMKLDNRSGKIIERGLSIGIVVKTQRIDPKSYSKKDFLRIVNESLKEIDAAPKTILFKG